MARTLESFRAARNLAIGISSAIVIGLYLSDYLFATSQHRLEIGFVLFFSICIAVFSTWHLFLIKRPILSIVLSLIALVFIAFGSQPLATFLGDPRAGGALLFIMIEICTLTIIPMCIASALYHWQPKKGPYILCAIIFLFIMAIPAWNAFVHWLIYL